ncbi:MAG: fimbrillin family protein [Prevotellaceae bacterium]|jgi:hypothetical protein|nr:fimbrillin family protein [Prevotellaceae bacterium]
MKRIFWGLAALPLLMLIATSCAQEVVESKNDINNQIGFSAFVGKQTLTKVAEFTNSSWASGNTFTARAYINGTATLFHDFPLTFDGTNWSYPTPLIYHPASTTLTYFACYPSASFTLGASTATATLSYTTAPGAGELMDLIAATTTTTSPAVTLTFNHILSQINFAVQGITDVDILVSNIAVNSVSNTGTYLYNSGTWSGQSGTATYPYTPHTGAMHTNGSNAILYLGNGGGTNTYTNALMLMPQTFTPSAGGNFTFSYTITDHTTSAVLKSGAATAYFGDFSVTTWVPGKRYVYLIDFSNLFEDEPITFTIEVNPWEEDSPFIAPVLYVANATKRAIETAISAHNTTKGSTSLNQFPISLPQDPVDIELDTFDEANFAVGDKIIINCPDGVTSGITLSAGKSSIWALTTSGKDVILTKS